MPEFFVETYHPMAASQTGAPGPIEVAGCAEQLSLTGRPVSLLRAILVPEDETCLYLFEAHTPDLALDSVTASGLRVLRVLPAESIWVRTFGAGKVAEQPPPLDPPRQGGPSHRP